MSMFDDYDEQAAKKAKQTPAAAGDGDSSEPSADSLGCSASSSDENSGA